MNDASDSNGKKPANAGLKRHLVPVLLLLAATFAVYAQSLGHEFLAIWDDESYVTANETVRGFTAGHLKAAFTNYYVGNYAPLHIVSYMLDYTLWGMRPAGFIFTNILLHALNGLLYYALLIRITGRRLWAFLASFVFLLHPVQVESVAWISQRKNVLAMFFFLVSFLLYIGYRESGFGIRDSEKANQNSKFKIQNSKLLYAGSVLSFVLSLLAKSVAVILPPLLVIYDFCFLEERKRRNWLADKIPYVAAAAVIALVAMKSQAPEIGGGRTGYHGGSPMATFFTMLPVLARYLGMLFWPANLSAAYNPPIKTGFDASVALSTLLLVLLAVGCVYLYRRRKDLLFWGLLFFVGLLPVSQIVPLVTLMNDRYLYFPMLGAAAFFAGIVAAGVGALGERSRKAAVAAVCLLLLVLPFLSFKRAEAWQDAVTLWTDAVNKVPDSVVACDRLGSAYHKMGKLDMALSFYQRALSIEPLDRDLLNNISALYLDAGEFNKAFPYVQRLVENYPAFAVGFVTLGNYHFMAGDLQNAEGAYHKALALQPRSAVAMRNLGLVYAAQKKADLARRFFLQAMETGGETAELHYNLACLEAVSGRSREALSHLEAAFRLGYKDFNFVLRDAELENVKNQPEFHLLLRKYSGE